MTTLEELLQLVFNQAQMIAKLQQELAALKAAKKPDA